MRRQRLTGAQEQLVAVVQGVFPGRRLGVSRVHQQMQTAGVQLGHAEQGELRDGAALAREPALPGQPAVQQVGE